MFLIIVGGGDIGLPLIDVATRSGNDVVVIERDAERADRVADEHDCLVLNADATTKETLSDAGAERADGLISTTDQDATNIMVCHIGTEMDIPSVISVVYNPEHMEPFRRIGVNTMENPQELIAEHLYRAVARPAIVDHMRISAEAEVFEITVAEGADHRRDAPGRCERGNRSGARVDRRDRSGGPGLAGHSPGRDEDRGG